METPWNGGTVNLESPVYREAQAPQSVRPPGAENYPEPCPRENGALGKEWTEGNEAL
jgi:hypothetical protein